MVERLGVEFRRFLMVKSTINVSLLILFTSNVIADEVYCSKPDYNFTSKLVKQCLDKSKKINDSKLCSLYYEDYLKDYEKWKSCRLQEIQLENNAKIAKFVEDSDSSLKSIRKGMYCLNLGKFGEPNTLCDFSESR